MSILNRIRERIRRDRAGRRMSERDAPADTGTARTRAAGGVPEPRTPDRHSTTGTTPSGNFVGRASGDEADAGQTGAEARAEDEEHRTGRHAKDDNEQQS